MIFELKLFIAMNKVYDSSCFSCFEKAIFSRLIRPLAMAIRKNKLAYLIHQSMKNNMAFSFNANCVVPFPSNPIKRGKGYWAEWLKF